VRHVRGTRDTVAGDTPARWATSLILRGMPAGLTVGELFEEEPISGIDFKKLTGSPGAVKDARRSDRSVNPDASEPVSYCGLNIWGRSSVGRALAWHARGSGVRFSSPPPEGPGQGWCGRPGRQLRCRPGSQAGSLAAARMCVRSYPGLQKSLSINGVWPSRLRSGTRQPAHN
jgi:hypothetical protein